MAIFRWGANFDPLAGLRYMQRELERLHGSLFGESRRVGGGTYPPVNVYESGDEILVQCEVPGVEPGDVEALITGETLAIKGVKRVPPEDEDVKFVRRERGGGE
jgi:HSP20 family protein